MKRGVDLLLDGSLLLLIFFEGVEGEKMMAQQKLLEKEIVRGEPWGKKLSKCCLLTRSCV